ncbi:MAG: type II toxin-antitoxin system PemK/MazF family toxin [Christensenellales bacterium]|jgi:hypothetical protein
MRVKPWEIWYAAVRYEDELTVQDRPVLITSANKAVIIAFKITKTKPRNMWGEYELVMWKSAGLDVPSTVRLTKQINLTEKDMRRRIGALQLLDILEIQRIIDG